jgi:hypothetical protein
MTDRLTLTRAFEGAGIQSEAAERIAATGKRGAEPRSISPPMMSRYSGCGVRSGHDGRRDRCR